MSLGDALSILSSGFAVLYQWSFDTWVMLSVSTFLALVVSRSLSRVWLRDFSIISRTPPGTRND